MEPTRIVVVEDEHIVALDIKMHLQKYGYEVPGMFASGEELLERIESLSPDLVLMDIKLQGKLDGLETSKIIKEKYSVPVILLTAFADEATIERAKTIEPFGYIIKPFEEKELRTTIVIALYKHKMERKLRDREELFSTILSSIGDGVVVLDDSGRIEYFNPVSERLSGRRSENVMGKMLSDVLVLEEAEESVRSHYPSVRSLRSEGGTVHLETTSSPLVNDRGERSGTVLILHDVTERLAAERAIREREEQLRHAQKMESIGRLAGGIAHDFNNLLTVIMGYSKLIIEDVGTNSVVKSNIEGIQQAALKSVTLTRQLLTFSRYQVMEMKTVNLNRLVAELEKMLRRLISEETSISFSLDAPHADIYVDHGQIEQVLVNLVVNARDAMPDGGTLTIRTGTTLVDKELPSRMGIIKPGSYVTLTVRDSGVGMTSDILPKIFDPFFTTKESGRGTGLGLSMVYGIIQQSSGHIVVDSTPGKGTVFQIYFPLQTQQSVEVKREEEEKKNLSGSETILLVEDEEYVRTLMARLLVKQGYHVVEAQNAGEALLICEEHQGNIQMLVTDIVLPHMNGSKLAKRLLLMKPDLKVLYVSGYPLKTIQDRNLLQPGDEFLQKPFEVDSFAAKVRAILDS